MNPESRVARPEELLAHASWLRALAASLVGDAASADDLVQDTWLAALRRPPRSDRPLRPWLSRVVRNFARNRRRGELRRAAHEADVKVALVVQPPDEVVSELEAQRLLVETLLGLEEPQRSTVVLRYFRGLDSSQIAKLHGVPAGTVRWRLQRGIEELREQLDARFGGSRSSWCALLAPLGFRHGSAPIGKSVAASAGAVATGVLAMSAVAKVVAASAVLALVGAILTIAWPANTGPRAQIVEAHPSVMSAGAPSRVAAVSFLPPPTAVINQRQSMGENPKESVNPQAIQQQPPEWTLLCDTHAVPMNDLGPRGMTISPSGELFVVDYGAKAVRAFGADCGQRAESREVGWFASIAYRNGMIYGARPGGGLSVLDEWTLDEIKAVPVADPGGLWRVNSLCFDSAGNAHVLSAAKGEVYVFDEALSSVGKWNAGPDGVDLCQAPNDLLLVASSTGLGSTIYAFHCSEGAMPQRDPSAATFTGAIVDLCVTEAHLYVATEADGIFVYKFEWEQSGSLVPVGFVPPGAGLVRPGRSSVGYIAVDENRSRLHIAYGDPDRVVVSLQMGSKQQQTLVSKTLTFRSLE